MDDHPFLTKALGLSEVPNDVCGNGLQHGTLDPSKGEIFVNIVIIVSR